MINLTEGFSSIDEPVKFEIGEVIEHKRYRYRGVIVDFDKSCKATNSWYESNQTQPDRKQPWYHVLVDGNQQVTYVAESNLVYDRTGQPVMHPMLNLFFSDYIQDQNKYVRNNTPWNPGNPPDAPPSGTPPDFTPPPPNS